MAFELHVASVAFVFLTLCSAGKNKNQFRALNSDSETTKKTSTGRCYRGSPRDKPRKQRITKWEEMATKAIRLAVEGEGKQMTV